MTTQPAFLAHYQQVVAADLERAVPSADEPPVDVHRAMRHTLLAPSKRVRAVLAYLAAEVCGSSARARGVATAVELVHASSLILDDLPCMDDAPLRRGRPACHIAFGEATALLASFNLLTLAFALVNRQYEPPLATELSALLAATIGSQGLIGGQAEDLASGSQPVTFERLERIHRLKTGTLFVAAAVAGARTAGAAPAELTQLEAYAKNLGLAFQVVDDLLDVTGNPAETGKLTRQDAKKTTFVSFSGPDGARLIADELCQTANRALTPFGVRADKLRELSAFVVGRRI